MSDKTLYRLNIVLNYLDTHEQIRTVDVAKMFNISIASSRRILTFMVEHNILSSSGSNRNKIYYLSK